MSEFRSSDDTGEQEFAVRGKRDKNATAHLIKGCTVSGTIKSLSAVTYRQFLCMSSEPPGKIYTAPFSVPL